MVHENQIRRQFMITCSDWWLSWHYIIAVSHILGEDKNLKKCIYSVYFKGNRHTMHCSPLTTDIS